MSIKQCMVTISLSILHVTHRPSKLVKPSSWRQLQYVKSFVYPTYLANRLSQKSKTQVESPCIPPRCSPLLLEQRYHRNQCRMSNGNPSPQATLSPHLPFSRQSELTHTKERQQTLCWLEIMFIGNIVFARKY